MYLDKKMQLKNFFIKYKGLFSIMKLSAIIKLSYTKKNSSIKKRFSIKKTFFNEKLFSVKIAIQFNSKLSSSMRKTLNFFLFQLFSRLPLFDSIFHTPVISDIFLLNPARFFSLVAQFITVN